MMSDADRDRSPRRRGRPPNVDGAQTRARLLDAALELFARNGYAATSVRQIAEAVGLRDSAIYTHFDGKRAIYDALLDHAGPGALERLEVDIRSLADLPPAEALPGLVDGLAAAWDEERARLAMSMLVREGLVGLADALAEVRERLTPLFTAWRRQGAMRDDVSVDLLAWEFTSPLATTRLLFFHADATPAERRRGHDLARAHARFFVDIAGPTGETEPTARSGGRR